MLAVEESIRRLIKHKFSGRRPVGLITADANDGCVSHSGTIELGFFSRKKVDVVEAFFSSDSNPDLGGLLQDLYESFLKDERGPWYHCKIRIDPDWSIRFDYFLESTPFKSVKELEADELGSVPSFVFKRRFDLELIAELSDSDVNRGLSYHVISQLSAGHEVSRLLLEIYATSDWEGDVNNGATNQYFARREEPGTGIPRSDLYSLVHAGLKRIGSHSAAAVFAESLALYSHFYPEVEAARAALGIPPVSKQEESDIMQRYYEVQPDLEGLRADYLRKFGTRSA